VITKTGNKSEL